MCRHSTELLIATLAISSLQIPSRHNRKKFRLSFIILIDRSLPHFLLFIWSEIFHLDLNSNLLIFCLWSPTNANNQSRMFDQFAYDKQSPSLNLLRWPEAVLEKNFHKTEFNFCCFRKVTVRDWKVVFVDGKCVSVVLTFISLLSRPNNRNGLRKQPIPFHYVFIASSCCFCSHKLRRSEKIAFGKVRGNQFYKVFLYLIWVWRLNLRDSQGWWSLTAV